jgi:hypothetical protein
VSGIGAGLVMHAQACFAHEFMTGDYVGFFDALGMHDIAEKLIV